jgi:hypothetical protein
MDVGGSLRWLSASMMAYCYHFDSTSDPDDKNPGKLGWFNCIRMLPCAYGEYIHMLKHFVYVQYGCGKQIELAVSVNHEMMTSS